MTKCPVSARRPSRRSRCCHSPTLSPPVLFKAYDFDASGAMTFDELTILFVSAFLGFTAMTGIGRAPKDTDMEVYAKMAYAGANRDGGGGNRHARRGQSLRGARRRLRRKLLRRHQRWRQPPGGEGHYGTAEALD